MSKSIAAVLLMLVLALPQTVQAHLMVAQRGTLNLVGTGAFMVLSIPVSAFKDADVDGDRLLSRSELNAHARNIETQLKAQVQLRDGDRALPLEGVMMQLSPPDDDPAGAASQLIVLGRFAIGEASSSLRFRFRLFGAAEDEKSQDITVSRGAQVQRLLLTPGREEGELMPPSWKTFGNHLVEGFEHVLSGADHLLFLLVVLASGWELRKILLALTSFTLGHALTMSASVLGGLSLSSAIVEPAIAATIVGMALFDRWTAYGSSRWAAASTSSARYLLVFGCALIHGLGFAGALGDLGPDTGHRLWSLAGFNTGVELAQVGVATVVAVSLLALHRVMPSLPKVASQFASIAAISLGTMWFIQRIAAFA